MMMLTVTLLGAWLLMVVVPETPIARALRLQLIDAPAKFLSRYGRGHVALIVILAGLAASVAWIGEGDGVRVLAMAAPELTTWLTTFEIAAYLDVALVAVAGWSAARLRLPLIISRCRPRSSRRQVRTRRRVRDAAANDDGDTDGRRAA